jgi:hypothetical protein
MIDIYTEKKNSKDWILQNDLYFNLNTGNEEMSKMKLIFQKMRSLDSMIWI